MAGYAWLKAGGVEMNGLLSPSFVNRLRQEHFGGQESTTEGRLALSSSEPDWRSGGEGIPCTFTHF